MHFISYLLTTLVAIGSTEARPSRRAAGSSSPSCVKGKYVVSSTAKFNSKALWTFTGNKLPSGLTASDYEVGTNRIFKPSNVIVKDGYLQLLVNGNQKSMPYKCGQIVTDVDNITSASVRTTAILSPTPGVVNGMFFYENDTEETDIEWVSDPNSGTNKGTAQLWFTNQDSNGDGKLTSKGVKPPSDATSAAHEYRIDWTAGLTQFYIDGTLTWQTTSDVPDVPGPWMWNNWSNGNKGWSAGPPTTDAIFKISKIEMYYNTSSSS